MIPLYKSNPEYIYILQEREFFDKKEPVYKIGRTAQTIQDRLSGYPKQTKLIFCMQVTDSNEAERLIKSELKQKTKLRNDIGSEYFEGQIKDIISITFAIIKKCENERLRILGIAEDNTSPDKIRIKIHDKDIEEEQVYECEECKGECICRSEDLDYDTSSIEDMYVCHRCDELFNTKEELERHWRYSTIPCDLVCCECGMRMSSKRTYQRHRKRGEECKYKPNRSALEKALINNKQKYIIVNRM